MWSKVNLKARIDRHSKILKEKFKKSHPLRIVYNKINKNFVLFFVVCFFPIYPLFASFFYESKNWNFSRIDIDETSIIDAYDNVDENAWDKIILSQEAFLSVHTLSDSKRDLSWFNEVIEYEVMPWDSFFLISQKFQVSVDSILWANNFDSRKILRPWDKIKIPPVTWLIHIVKEWETISSIAKNYKVDEQKIITQNNLTWSDILEVWKTLIIPDAIKIIPKSVLAKKEKNSVYSFKSWWSWWSSQYVNTSWVYQLVKRKPKSNFVWGNCTRFVAQYKNVDWSWNAKDWLNNAKAKWHPTWKNPWIGSIVVFNGKWYNPWYWHVWIVVDITKDHIIVKDMNYRRINEITTRKVPKTDRAIMWYIYVD